LDLKPAYLIAGSDWPKVDAALTRLRARFAEESVEQIAVGGETDGDVVAACNALDLLGGPRLVLVRNAEELDPERRQAIADYLADPAPGACLAIFGGAGFEPGEPLVQAVEAAGDVRFFDAPDRKRAAEWVVKRFFELGIRCPQPVARRVVELAGEDMGDLALEIEKLATFGRDSAPDEDDVARLVPASVDVKPWEITDAWGRGDAPAMIALAVADIERPDEVSRVVAVLAGHVRKVCRAAAMVESGAGQDEVAKALRLKSYPARKLVDQAQRFGRGELGAAVIRLAEVDIAVKGGSRLDPRFELELALAEIARKR
jgi:DNA polymerase III subunit delta